MLEVTIGTNLNRSKYILSPTTTLAEALEEAGISTVSSVTVYLNHASIGPNDLSKSFYDLCPDVEKPWLMVLDKLDNAR